jgi:hypothetical protein
MQTSTKDLRHGKEILKWARYFREKETVMKVHGSQISELVITSTSTSTGRVMSTRR